MSASPNPSPPGTMTVDEFLAWDAPGPYQWQLMEGEPRAMAPASRTHGAIQAQLAILLGSHLAARSSLCSVIIAPGLVPRVRSNANFRIPDLAVTCAPYAAEEHALTDPVLVVEILSPSNAAETWSNIWTYTTIPSVREILVLRSATIGAELLCRNADGTWPDRAEAIKEGELVLDSVEFRCALTDVYRTTRLHESRDSP